MLVVDDGDAVDCGADGEHTVANLRNRLVRGSKDIVRAAEATVSAGPRERSYPPAEEEIGDIAPPACGADPFVGDVAAAQEILCSPDAALASTQGIRPRLVPQREGSLLRRQPPHRPCRVELISNQIRIRSPLWPSAADIRTGPAHRRRSTALGLR